MWSAMGVPIKVDFSMTLAVSGEHFLVWVQARLSSKCGKPKQLWLLEELLLTTQVKNTSAQVRANGPGCQKKECSYPSCMSTSLFGCWVFESCWSCALLEQVY